MKSFGYVIRTLSCFLLLFATWNPLGYSYLDWLAAEDGGRISVKVAAGAVLLAVHAAYLRIAWVALGFAGTMTAAAIVLSGYLTLRQAGLLDPGAPFWSAYLLLILGALVLSVGISWSHFKRRISGQSHVLSPPP